MCTEEEAWESSIELAAYGSSISLNINGLNPASNSLHNNGSCHPT